MALTTTPGLLYSLILRVTHLTPTGRTLPCGPHHNTRTTLLFNIEGNTLHPQDVLSHVALTTTPGLPYSLILRVTHLHPKDVLSHVAFTTTLGLPYSLILILTHLHP